MKNPIESLRELLEITKPCRPLLEPEYQEAYDRILREYSQLDSELTVTATVQQEMTASLWRKVIEMINLCEKVWNSKTSDEFKFDTIFNVNKREIQPLLRELDIRFDYYDPDTTFEEDTAALMRALLEVREKLVAVAT